MLAKPCNSQHNIEEEEEEEKAYSSVIAQHFKHPRNTLQILIEVMALSERIAYGLITRQPCFVCNYEIRLIVKSVDAYLEHLLVVLCLRLLDLGCCINIVLQISTHVLPCLQTLEQEARGLARVRNQAN